MRVLVGRETELAVLNRLVDRGVDGDRIAVLEGEAGIGKTRLVEATVERARGTGVTVLAARAEEVDTHRPFGAIADCFASAGDPAWRDRLNDALGPVEPAPDVAAEQQFRISELVVELLEGLSAGGGRLAVVVEDLHWADAASLDALGRIARRAERLPVVLLLSARPHPRRAELERLLSTLHARGATYVRVGPLDEEAVAALVASIAGAPPGERLAAHVRGAAGNPFFVSELVSSLAADEAIERRGGRAEVAVAGPAPSLPVTILRRLRLLPPDELALLPLAAVLGRSFTARDLALLADRPVAQLLPALRAAIDAGAIAEVDDRLAFRHELIRDALYGDMPVSVRRGLHHQLARALTDAGGAVEQVAEHVVRGAEPGDREAVQWLFEIARSLAARSPAGALDLYREAISLAADPDAARSEILPEMAEALVAAGFLGEGEEACREALAAGAPTPWVARLRLYLVAILTRRSRMEEAIREGVAGLDEPGLDERERDQLTAWVALSRVFIGQLDEAVALARSVVESSDDTARGVALNTLGMAADARGRFEEAAELMLPRAQFVEERGTRSAHDTRPHMVLSLQLARLDRLDEAYMTIQRGRRAAELLGMADPLPIYHYQLAFVDYLRGRLDDAVAELGVHAELAEQTEVGWTLTFEALRALILIHRDELAEATECVVAAERQAAAGAPPFGTDLMVVARARLMEADGLASAGLDLVAGTFDAFASAGAATFLPVLGSEVVRLAQACGEASRAEVVAGPLSEIAAANPGGRSLRAAALRARGVASGDAALLRQAVDLMGQVDRPIERAQVCEDAAAVAVAAAPAKVEAGAAEAETPAAQTHAGAGNALGAGGGSEIGRELLERARADFVAAGAARDVARVEAALRRFGERRGVRGPRGRPQTGWESLTETELKVVRLVAERLSNPEIAERLFISRRTVQTHVSHALAKLGVSTRRELAAAAAREAGWRVRVEDDGG